MRPKHIAIIGAPLDLGAGRRGVDMGPSAVRVANLNGRLAQLGYEVEDLGNVPVVQRESQGEVDSHAKYLPQIAETCTLVAGMVEARWGRTSFRWCWEAIIPSRWEPSRAPRSIFIGSGEKLGMIWIDAHTDMNTPESSPSGNVHGMPLACCIGQGPRGADRTSSDIRPRWTRPTSRWWAFARWMAAERDNVQRFRGSCVYDARYRRARHAFRD